MKQEPMQRLLIQETQSVWDLNQIGIHDIVVVRNFKPSRDFPKQDYYGMVIGCHKTNLNILLNIECESAGEINNNREATFSFSPNLNQGYDEIQVMMKAVKMK